MLASDLEVAIGEQVSQHAVNAVHHNADRLQYNVRVGS